MDRAKISSGEAITNPSAILADASSNLRRFINFEFFCCGICDGKGRGNIWETIGLF